MPTFSPPLVDSQASLGGDEHPLWRHYGNIQQGKTVWKGSDNQWYSSVYPYQGGEVNRHFNHDQVTTTIDTDPKHLANAKEIYYGGGLYEVDITKAIELTAAGFPFEWWQLTDWTHAWDAKDSLLEGGGRIYQIPDKRGRKPLIKMPDDYPLLGAIYTQWGALPGPKYLPSSPRFNNRPALLTDSFPVTGSFFPLFSGLAPNGTGITSADDVGTWFNTPNGYPQPYWVAVLARLTTGSNSAIWDATHGGVGTGPTIGPDIFGGVDDKWEVSLFGPDLLKIESSHVSSVDETVLVFVYVNGASSFLEVNWRQAGGAFGTVRTSGTLGAYNYLEAFLGWVHDTYWATTGIKLGTPTEPELDFIRSWGQQYMPPAGFLPDEG